jgi:hypothetical protein
MGEAGDTSSMVMPKPMSPPMPPVQQTGDDVTPPVPNPNVTGIPPGGTGSAPPLPPDPSTSDIAAGIPPGGAPVPAPGTPMPQPRPAMANMPPPTPPLPPNAAPPVSQGPIPLPPQQSPMSPPLPPGGPPPQAKGILGRAIGLDPNREAQLRGSLSAGLKSVGDNWNKPGLAALSGSAGSAIEGGKAADDKTTDQQDRFLGRQISSKNADTTALNSASTRTLNAARTKQALADAQTKMTGGKDSVLNSQQQLYLRGSAAANGDPAVKASAATLKQVEQQFGVDSKEAKQARDIHGQLIENTRKRVLGTLGVDEKAAAKLGKMPGMSQDNPVPKEGLDQKKFESLAPGSYFVNPKDGQVYIKKGTAAPAAGANPAAAPQSQMTPAVPPTPPAAAPKVASMPASDDDEET